MAEEVVESDNIPITTTATEEISSDPVVPDEVISYTIDDDDDEELDTRDRLFCKKETYVWLLLLALLIYYNPRSHVQYMVLANLVLRFVNEEFLNCRIPLPETHNPELYRTLRGPGDRHGAAMAIVLLPVLMEAMQMHQTKHATKFLTYSQATAIAMVFWGHTDLTLVIPTIYSVNVSHTPLMNIMYYLFVWISFQFSLKFSPFLQRVFTWGEWMTVSSLTSMAVTELTLRKVARDRKMLAELMAHGLIMGSLLTFIICRRYKRFWLSLQAVVVVALPLFCVEMVTWRYGAKLMKEHYVPKAWNWFTGFMKEAEHPRMTNKFLSHDWPRYVWVGYEAVLVLACIPLGYSIVKRYPTVISRKWFHLVAVLLFLPSTLAAPRLQQLIYAAGCSVLILVEAVRHKVGFVTDYYSKFIDDDDDEATTKREPDSLITSHLALVFGCAMPSWFSRFLITRVTGTFPTVLAVTGLVAVGVGDAVAAVVGQRYGQRQWGLKGRTVLGSVSMLASMLVTYGAVVYSCTHQEWEMHVIYGILAAAVFAALLEAHTLQNDNLVLPLVCCTILLIVTKILQPPQPLPVNRKNNRGAERENRRSSKADTAQAGAFPNVPNLANATANLTG